jgi:predicted nucleotidyltransferase
VEENLKSALHKAIAFLEENKIRYAIIGGIALAQWEVARYTHDIDIKVLVPDIDYTKIRKLITSTFPIEGRPHLPPNPLIIAVLIDEVIVDFLLALPGYEQLIIERAKQCDLEGFRAWVCSPEDLIIQKMITGRGKDRPDIEALLIEQHGTLDEAYIEDWLAQFSEALDNPGLLSEFRDLQQKTADLFNNN